MRRALLGLLLVALAAPAWAQSPIVQIPPPGPEGAIGPAGLFGEQGPTGDTGAEGPQGPAGATGPNSIPVLFVGDVEDVSSVDISDFVSEDYLAYEVFFSLMLSDDDKELRLRSDAGGDESWDTGASDYGFTSHGVSPAGEETNADTAADFISLTSTGSGLAVGADVGESIAGSIWLDQLGSASLAPLLRWHIVYTNADGSPTIIDGAGVRNTAAALTGLQLLAEDSPTTTLTGQVRVYGRRSVNPD